jgi:hypothetical protein
MGELFDSHCSALQLGHLIYLAFIAWPFSMVLLLSYMTTMVLGAYSACFDDFIGWDVFVSLLEARLPKGFTVFAFVLYSSRFCDTHGGSHHVVLLCVTCT